MLHVLYCILYFLKLRCIMNDEWKKLQNEKKINYERKPQIDVSFF